MKWRGQTNGYRRAVELAWPTTPPILICASFAHQVYNAGPMLPALGVIIGGYVITRMLEVLLREPKPPTAVFFAAAITLIATVFALLVMLGNAAEFMQTLPADFR